MKNVENYIVITDDEYNYTPGYFTMNKWTKDGDIILVRHKQSEANDENRLFQLVRYSVSKKAVVDILCEDARINHIVHDNMLYYSTDKALKSINIETKEKKVIFEYDDVRYEMPHITNDGKYLNLEGHQANGTANFVRVNLETGEWKIIFKKKFSAPFTEANHGMICPTNPDIVYFAHEGSTEYITNRMWVYDVKEDKMRNIVKQEMTEDSDLGECFGHEMWASDGKGLYFVKYPQSPIKPTGLYYSDFVTGKKEALFSGFPYWHVGVSKDGKYLIADTMRGVFDGTDLSEVVLADIKEKSETVIDVIHANSNHPGHPHPSMSPDSSKIVYTAVDNGKIITKIAFLKDVD